MGFIRRGIILIKNLNKPIFDLKYLSYSPNSSEHKNYSEKTITPKSKELKNSEKQFSLVVAVIGVPNAGKSTFINNIINHRVCPTSSKVHTTRTVHRAICTTGNTQLVFLDTPGLVTQREIKKHHLSHPFKSAYRHAIHDADLLAIVHDVSNNWSRTKLHPTVLDTLKAYPSLPSILILNKIDTLKSKRILLDLIRILSNGTLSYDKRKQNYSIANVCSDSKPNTNDVDKAGWSYFSKIFLVSSITGNGINDIQHYLINNSKESLWQYPSNKNTDITPEELVVESVRARLLDYLPQEIPYNLKCCLEFYEAEKDKIYTSVEIICRSIRIEKLICGQSNGKLRQITERVSSDLVEIFNKPVSVTLTTRSS